MPLTKQYLRYVAARNFGLVTSRKGDALLYGGPNSSLRGKRLAVCPALEDVIVWDLKTSSKVAVLSGEGEVGVVCLSHDHSQLAVGREDGSVQLWAMVGYTLAVAFNGHKSAVTCLKFDASGTHLVSGSKDTHLILWDVVSQTGLFRLKGHKGPITGCALPASYNVLISGSKDGVVKLWDLETQHCFQTIVGHRSEVWSLEIIKGETRLLTASGEGGSIKVFDLQPPAISSTASVEQIQESQEKVPLVAMEMGHVTCQNKERLSMIKVEPSGKYLALLSTDSVVEIYHMLSVEELSQRIKKKTKKAQKKSGKEPNSVSLSAEEELKYVCSVTSSTKGKTRSVDLLVQPKGGLLILLALQNNSVELYSMTDDSSPPELLHSLSNLGHRSDIRTVCFSSDDSKILSASSNSLKLWNRSSLQCTATLSCGYALCSTFVPGDRHIVIGTKSGHIQLFDLPSSSLLDDIPAHSGAVWGLALSPDKRSVVSCSADKTVKFWEFELVQSSSEGGRDTGRRLILEPLKTLQMSEDVMSVCYSPDQRLLAISLLDSTVKVLFADSLKFFLSLYGHKLPVLSTDISTDNTLLVSCSVDKNIRIWGLDFGDCHKSIFAHDDSIMAIRFIPNTHMFFSASKDRTIKCWDADNFQHIQTLKGHHGEVWSLAVSHDGNTVVTGSQDLSLRLWERTQEPLVLSEEREMEREALMETMASGDSAEIVVPGESSSGEASLPVSKTTETLSTVDRLLEALEIWKTESDELQEHREQCELAGKELPLPKQHPMLVAMGNIKAERHALNVLRQIKSSALEECLLVMPFSQVTQLLHLLDIWLGAGWEVELCCRCLFFLLRVHHHQLVTNSTLLPIMDSLKQHTSQQVSQIKDMYGLNLAGLQYMQLELDKRGTHVFGDAPELIRKRRKLTT